MHASEIGPEFIPTIASGVGLLDIADETLAIQSESGRVHVLDGNAGLLVRCFDGSGTIREIATDIADGFGAPREMVESDAVALAQSVGSVGLLLDVQDETPGGKWASSADIDADPRFVLEPPSS